MTTSTTTERRPADVQLFGYDDISADLMEQFLQATSLAVDTETTGLNPLRDRLCLVQISDGISTSINRIPNPNLPGVTKNMGYTPLRQFHRLARILTATTSVKVFHHARFDVGFLRAGLGIDIPHIFCTKLASKIARTYTGSHGLASAIKEAFGIELPKTEQTSGWGREILTEAQLTYAARDVEFLLPLKEYLTEILMREGRWELYRKVLTGLHSIVELDLNHFDLEIYNH